MPKAKSVVTDEDEKLIAERDDGEPEVEVEGAARIRIYRVTGTYDLLMHNPASMRSSGNGELEQKSVPPPEVEAKSSRYVTDDDELYIPAQAIRNSIVDGGKYRRVGRLSARAMLNAGLFHAEERCILHSTKTGKPLRGEEYRVDTRRVVLKQAGGIDRSRARISNWTFDVPLELDIVIADKLVLDAGKIDGRIVGVLEYRPSHGGPFGRYKIELIS